MPRLERPASQMIVKASAKKAINECRLSQTLTAHLSG